MRAVSTVYTSSAAINSARIGALDAFSFEHHFQYLKHLLTGVADHYWDGDRDVLNPSSRLD
jgi:hypothetical protein